MIKWLIAPALTIGAAIGWQGAQAQPSTLSDILAISSGNQPLVTENLTQGDEAAGTHLVASFVAHSINFVTTGYGVSDNVSFAPFNASFFSDTETTFPTFTPSPNAITRTVTGENAALAVLFASDGNPTPTGANSDLIEFDLITVGQPTQVLASKSLTETGNAEFTTFDLPQTVITFAQGDGTNSDILVMDPVFIDVTSDIEDPLHTTGDITITGQTGPIFRILAASDPVVPEPATLTLFGAALAGLGLLRRKASRG